MAKIKINKLPKGFKIKDGKVVKEMQQGGMTGSQFDYGLATGGSSMESSNSFTEGDMKYSLTSVPRDMANLEAEGGETVLTDLNDDGQFGLYNINGPRHSSGGVPMFLPEQSFIFSDTQKMKFKKNELAEFGIESKKAMTPAKISKKYQLNEFIGALASPDVDSIKANSADLMIDKNMKSLSKLAFGQEAKKQFSDGVPLAAYPYLVSQGQDPVEFTAKVENINKQQATLKAISALPPEQQAQIMALRDMMEQSGQGGMQQQIPQQMPPQMPQEMAMAQYGTEMLPQAQYGVPTFPPLSGTASGAASGVGTSTMDFESMVDKVTPAVLNEQTRNALKKKLEDAFNAGGPSGLAGALSSIEQQYTPSSSSSSNSTSSTSSTSSTTPKKKKSGKTNVAWDPKVIAYYERLGIDVNSIGVGETNYKDRQGYKKGSGLYGDAAENQEGFYEAWKDKYPDIESLKTSISSQKADGTNPDVEKFQHWINDTYIPEEVQRIKATFEEEGKEWTPEMESTLTASLNKDYGFDPNKKGKGYDGDFGTFTSSRRPLGRTAKPAVEKEPDPKIEIKPGDPEYKYEDPDKSFYTQDLLKMGALAMRDREMFLPWQPQVEIPKVDYVLEEPTRQLADTNEQLNIASQAIGAFAGPQSMNARLAQSRANAFKQNANVFAGTHGRNINTVNQGLAMNSQLGAAAKREQRDRSVSQYDATQLTQQNFMDEKNLDREQMADLTANAYTNMANTYSMNTLYPYYNVDPTQAGAIEWNNGAPPLAANKQSGNKLTPYDEMTARALDLKAKGLDGTTINTILGKTYGKNETAPTPQGYGADPYADKLRQIRSQHSPSSGYPTAKKGKEIKKFLPFYLGKIGY